MIIAFFTLGFSFVCSCLNTQKCFQLVYNYVLDYKQKKLDEEKEIGQISIYKSAKQRFLMFSYVFIALNAFLFLLSLEFLYDSDLGLFCGLIWLFFSMFFVSGHGQLRLFNIASLFLGVGFFFLGWYQLVFFPLFLALFLVIVHIEYILYFSFFVLFFFLILKYPFLFSLSSSLALMLLTSLKCRKVAKKESLNWVKRYRAGL